MGCLWSYCTGSHEGNAWLRSHALNIPSSLLPFSSPRNILLKKQNVASHLSVVPQTRIVSRGRLSVTADHGCTGWGPSMGCVRTCSFTQGTGSLKNLACCLVYIHSKDLTRNTLRFPWLAGGSAMNDISLILPVCICLAMNSEQDLEFGKLYCAVPEYQTLSDFFCVVALLNH